ncbi:MAG: TrbC/VirB2 family protein [Rhodocyclaceae bacterium]|nr:TrbC/VirB2 family protein [Rhodocyclaceae bacterium]MBR4737287.1 TrbC/VirB2 family protein [Rhodocyclaceae bacterium]MBR4877772.1 TrbC/VirB2 family protein [Rhodocyclaceae bacterium]
MTTATHLKRYLPALLTLGVLLLPEVALAQSSGDGGKISGILEAVIDLLTNVWAQSAATIAVAALGYLAFMGHLSWRWVIHIVLGIALVFGAAELVAFFIDA